MTLPVNVTDMMQIQTATYRPPTAYRPSFQMAGLPTFTARSIEWMKRDPQIRLGLSMKLAPYQKVKLTIKAEPEVMLFMAEQISRFWSRAIPKITQAFWYTVSGGEIIYREMKGRYEFWSYNDIYPLDFSILHKNQVPVGIAVTRRTDNIAHGSADGSYQAYAGTTDSLDNKIKLLFPKAFLYIHRREFNSLIGQSDFEPIYETWLEKNDYQGAKHSRKLWYFQCAFTGRIIFHPPGSYKDPDSDTLIPYADIARQAVETASNGGVWCIAQEYDTVTGKERWIIEQPKMNGSGADLLAYIKELDIELLRGLEIPDDVIQQQNGTSGSFGGRSIPLMAFFTSQESRLDNLFHVCDEQVFRPLCKVNFGHDDYEASMDTDIGQLLGEMATPLDPNGNGVPGGDAKDNPFGQRPGQPQQPGQSGGNQVGQGNGQSPITMSESQEDYLQSLTASMYNVRVIYQPVRKLVRMSQEREPAGQEHHNRSGKTSHGGQFVDSLTQSVRKNYKGPDTVADGSRAAGFTDNPKEVEAAKSLGLHVQSAGQFFVYGKNEQAGQELVNHLIKHGYGKTLADKVRLSELAGYSPEQIEEFKQQQQAAARDKVTETPEFKKWFGDSKVVDENGKPLVVYHGTADSIYEFDLDHPNRKDTGWLGTGVYLTTDSNIAGSYANLKAGSAGPNILPLYAKLENPYFAKIADKQRIQLISHNQGEAAGRDAADAWTRELKSRGYDGVILEFKASDVGKANASKEIVVFNTLAVKSATGNRGTFDSSSPSITMSQEHEPAGQTHRNRSGKVSKGGMFVDHAAGLAFGEKLSPEQAASLIGKIRSGDERSKHKGDSTLGKEHVDEPMVMSKVPISIFDRLANEKYPEDGSYLDFIKESTDPERVAEYAKQDIDTPITLFVTKDTKKPVVSDGGHRLMAAIQRGDKEIRAIVPESLHQELHGTQKPQAGTWKDLGSNGGMKQHYLKQLTQGNLSADTLRRSLESYQADPLARNRHAYHTVTMPLQELEATGYIERTGRHEGKMEGPGFSYAGPGSAPANKVEKNDPRRDVYTLTEKGWNHLGLEKPVPKEKEPDQYADLKAVRDPEMVTLAKNLVFKGEQLVKSLEAQKKPRLLVDAKRKLELYRKELAHYLSLPEGTPEELARYRKAMQD